jgi:hypothetical protein
MKPKTMRVVVLVLWGASVGALASSSLGQQPGWRDPTQSINGWSGYSLWQLGQGTPSQPSSGPSDGRTTYWLRGAGVDWCPPWWWGGSWYPPGYGWGYSYWPPVQANPNQFGFPVPAVPLWPGVPVVDLSAPAHVAAGTLQQQLAVQQAQADAFAAAERAANQDRTAQYVSKLRSSSAANRQRAERLIREGDDSLRDAADRRAMTRYRQAATAAPDLALPRWRVALAEWLTGSDVAGIDDAYVALDLGGIPQPEDLPVGELFADRRGELTALMDRLSQRALQDPKPGRWLLCIGLLLWADGQAERAETFFQASAAEAGEHQRFAELLR